MDRADQIEMLLIALGLAIVAIAIVGFIGGIYHGTKIKKRHMHNMAWPFRIVLTNADKYRVEQYVLRNKCWEWVEANRFETLGQADKYCVENMTSVMKNRIKTIANEELEDMKRRNEKVKKVIDMSVIEQTVRDNFAGSDEVIAYVTSEAYLVAHGGK